MLRTIASQLCPKTRTFRSEVFSMASRRNSFGFAQPTALPRKSRISCGRLSRLFSTSSKRTRNHASSLGFAAKPHEADARTFPFARPFRFVLARGVPHPRSFRDAGFALSLAEMPCGVGHREQRRGRGSSGQVRERLHLPRAPRQLGGFNRPTLDRHWFPNTWQNEQ